MPVSFSGLSHSEFIFVQTFLIFSCLSLLELNACSGTMPIPELFTPVSRNLLHNLALLVSIFCLHHTLSSLGQGLYLIQLYVSIVLSTADIQHMLDE